MTTDVVLVDRDPRQRPKLGWREAWSGADHLGGTISLFRYARRAVEDGGLRAVRVPLIACLLVGAAFLAVAVGAAVLAGNADGSTSRGFVLILASVVLSQGLALLQSQKLVKRLFVAAETRASTPPEGWGTVTVDVPTAVAPQAKRVLESTFAYVEVTYRRRGDATLHAWFGPVPQGTTRPELQQVADAALNDVPHTLSNVVVWH